MSGVGRSGAPVDWDLLADHLGGALDGTPEATRVAHLIATDACWTEAAEELSTALDAVAADLAALPPSTIPGDVAARLDAALTGAVRPDAGATRRPGVGATPEGSAARPDRRGGTPSSARPPTHPPARPGGPGRRTRRKLRWGAGAVVAAGLVAFAAVGLSSLPAGVVGGDDSADTGAAAPENAPAEAPLVGGDSADGPPTSASGLDYERSTLARAAHGNDAQPAAPGTGPDSAAERELGGEENDRATDDYSSAAKVPAALDRLTDEAALESCLSAVRHARGDPAAVVEVVDFARFEGAPALVIVFTDGDTVRRAWVAGPDCGTPTGGADHLYDAELR